MGRLKASSFVLSCCRLPAAKAPFRLVLKSARDASYDVHVDWNEAGNDIAIILQALLPRCLAHVVGTQPQRWQVDFEMDVYTKSGEKGFSTARSPTSSALTWAGTGMPLSSSTTIPFAWCVCVFGKQHFSTSWRCQPSGFWIMMGYPRLPFTSNGVACPSAAGSLSFSLLQRLSPCAACTRST